MKAYKVVHRKDGKLYSFISHYLSGLGGEWGLTLGKQYILEYLPGTETLPKEGTCLFAFETREQAERIIKKCHGPNSDELEIWLCEATLVDTAGLSERWAKPFPRCAAEIHYSEIRYFWQKLNTFPLGATAPKGSLWCENITLTEQEQVK